LIVDGEARGDLRRKKKKKKKKKFKRERAKKGDTNLPSRVDHLQHDLVILVQLDLLAVVLLY